MDPDTHIRNVTVDQQLANIRPATCLPQLSSSRMGLSRTTNLGSRMEAEGVRSDTVRMFSR